MKRRTIFLAALLAGACAPEQAEPPEAEAPGEAGVTRPVLPVPSGPPVPDQRPLGPPTAAAGEPRAHWESTTSGSGTALRLLGPDAKLVMSIACVAPERKIVAAVPGFTRIESEDRFSLALGEEPVTLVANPYEQPPSGIVAEGAAPENFKSMLGEASAVGALYGTQRTGPHPAPPEALKELLAKGCG